MTFFPGETTKIFSLLLTLITVAVVIAATGTSVFAFGDNECAASRYGEDLVCEAGDVSITGIAIAPGSPTKCIGGSTYTVDLDITVNFAVPDRWDVGVFLSEDGNDPKLLAGSGGSSSCYVGILPLTLPFLDLDSNGGADTCGDGNKDINGGTGSGVVRYNSVPVACKATNLSNGNLFIPFVVTWDNQKTPPGDVCTSIADPLPNTKSKCNAPNGSVATEVQFGTIETIVLPEITKDDGITTITAGDSTTYSVVITNTTGAAIVGALFKDPAVSDLTVNSLSCSATGGASCPATYLVAVMQGGGLLLPDMPADSTITFTIDATVNASATAGTITNTALVSFRGETNEASDTNDIITRLNASKSFTPASITAGETSVLSITVENANLEEATSLAFNDSYPAGLVNTTTPGVTNTCGGTATAAAGGNSLSLSGGSLPAGTTCTVSVNVTSATSGAYLNSTGLISSALYTGGPATANLAVGVSSLETSTKTWQDINGGEADPGDTLRYSITLIETAGVAATGVTVTDVIPATLSGATVQTCPAGATCSITAGILSASNVTVGANSSVIIEFEATIPAGLAAATAINNCVDIANPTGIGASTCASTITVSPSQVAITGNKWLYLDSSTTLSRTPPSGTPPAVTVARTASQTWSLSPVLAMPVTISPTVTPLAIIPVNLYLASDAADETRSVQVTVACSGGGTPYSQELIFDGTALNNPYLSTTPGYVLFNNLPFSAEQTCAAGESWNLTVQNTTPGNGTKNILVYPASAGNNSYFSIPSLSVINVDSVNSYSAAYPGVTTPVLGYYTAGETVYIRAVVSDPFGSYDINSTTITIKDPSGTNIVTDAPIVAVVATTAATKTYEYSYIIPAGAPAGAWSTIVTANEGTEGMVSDSGTGAFSVAQNLPTFLVSKGVVAYSDPVNGTTNPYAIPGSVVEYTLTITNTGFGSPDNNTVVITDPIPAETELVVTDPVVTISNVSANTGLTIAYISPTDAGDDIYFSTDGSDFTYQPTADANGADVNISHIRFNPQGVFSASDGTSLPTFSVSFKVRIK